MQNAISYMLGQANIDAIQQQRIEQTQRDCSLNAALCFAKNNILEYYYKSSNIITEGLIHSSLPNVSLKKKKFYTCIYPCHNHRNFFDKRMITTKKQKQKQI